MDSLTRARELEVNLLADRRFLHQHAEAGMELTVTSKYVMNRLQEMGLEPRHLGRSGIIADIRGGMPGKTILLRADMDALPMSETNELPFRTATCAAHNCGHDMHTAMLLTAAQILEENRSELHGTVKLMFQPGEEVFQGAKEMLDAGLLTEEHVDAAFAMHMTMDAPLGTFAYGEGYMAASCDGFQITVNGRGCHGAMPDLGIDPINVGVHIYQAMQNLIARETPPSETAVLTVGQFSAGTAANVIPSTAVLEGTLRTYSTELRSKLVKRIREVAERTAAVFNATVEYRTLSAVSPLYVDPALLHEMLGYIHEMDYPFEEISNLHLTGSEDFALISEKIPTVYLSLGATVEGNPYPLHHPGVQFNEGVLPLGAAIHAQCAFQWLKNH